MHNSYSSSPGVFRKKATIFLLILGVTLLLLGSCGPQLAGAVTCRQALENAVYDQEIRVYGTVSKLNELGVFGFYLSSDGRELLVFYASMMKDNGETLPNLNVDNLRNGDRVIVTGELKSAGKYRTQNSFWAFRIDKY